LTKTHFFGLIAAILMGLNASIEAQNFSLKLVGQTTQDQRILDDFDVFGALEDVTAVKNQLDWLQNQLYTKGYMALKILSLERNDFEFTAHISVGAHYEAIAIFGRNDWLDLLTYDIQKNASGQFFIVVPISKLEQTLNELSNLFSAQSYTFATLQLQNIIPMDDNQLRADLVVDKGIKRELQSIKILGYEKAPKSFIKHFLDIKTQTPFNLKDIQNQMALLDQLPFMQQKRPAEVLFTPDSTTVYMYLEKTQSNRFDGFLGFGSNETTGDLQFDGYLDLNLINNLNFGESLKLYYKSDEINQKTLDITADLPYLFGSPISAQLNLNIFKKDSTFTTTQQALKLNYPFNDKQQLGLGMRLVSSNALKPANNVQVEDYNSQFYELNYHYIKRQAKDLLFPIQSKLEVSLAFGQRQSEQSSQQRHIRLLGQHIFLLNSKNSIFLKLHLEQLQSERYLLNELLRFGGIRSIRGFQENSLFATQLAVLCSEYRYRLSSGLFVHSVIDAGYFQDSQNDEFRLYGFGLGFGLQTNGGLLRLTYANGKTQDTPFDLSNSKVHLSFTSTF
jgi:translocation and assembly module TamA